MTKLLIPIILIIILYSSVSPAIENIQLKENIRILKSIVVLYKDTKPQ
jgi:hypothetical protein